MRKGRLQRRGHDDGSRRRAPAKACALLWLTELEQRAMGTSGVAGVSVVLLRWRRSSEDELPSAMALAALVREWLQRRARKKAEETKNGAWKGVGRTLAGLRPCPGAAWPARTDRRRHAAVSCATRRAVSETGRPLCRSIQFVSRAMQCLTTYFRGA